MAEKKDVFKIKLTQPCVVVESNGEREHREAGEIVTVTGDDAHQIIGGGKGVLVDGELGNPLKGEKPKGAGR